MYIEVQRRMYIEGQDGKKDKKIKMKKRNAGGHHDF